jgi:hypothetical protein
MSLKRTLDEVTSDPIQNANDTIVRLNEERLMEMERKAKETESVILDALDEKGGEPAIENMVCFTREELRILWNTLGETVKQRFDGGNRKSSVRPFDVFLMTLIVLRFGGPWEPLARLFSMNTGAQ